MKKFSKYQELQIKEAINREGYYGSIAYKLFSQDVLKINDKDEYFQVASSILQDIKNILILDREFAEYILKRYFENYSPSKADEKQKQFLTYMKACLEDFYIKNGTSIEEKDSSATFWDLSSYFADINSLSEKDFNTYFKKGKKFEEIYEDSHDFLNSIRNLNYINYLAFIDSERKFKLNYNRQLEINYRRLFNVISKIKKYNLNIISIKILVNTILISTLDKISDQYYKEAIKFLQRFYIGLPILFISLAFLTTLTTSALLCLLVTMFFFYPLGANHKYLQILPIHDKTEDALFSTVINYAETMTQKGILIPLVLKNICTHLKKLDDSFFNFF